MYCCMYSTGELYEVREGVEALHAGGWWWEVLDTGIHPQNFR